MLTIIQGIIQSSQTVMISMVLQADVAEANFAKLSMLDRAERFTHYQVRTILRFVMSTKMYLYVRQSVQQIMFATWSVRIFGGCQSAGAIRRARRRGEVPAVAHRHWNEKKRVTGGAPAVAHRHWSEKRKKRALGAGVGSVRCVRRVIARTARSARH